MDRPVWDAPGGTGADYLRAMGCMSLRNLKGTKQWDNEHIYCGARRWLRFDPTVPWELRSDGKPVGRATPVFRRWMSDGRLVFRLEIGSRIWTSPEGRALPPDKIGDALLSLLSHPVETRGLGLDRKLKLGEVPAAAFPAYCRASSKHGSDLKPALQWLLRSAPVMIYIEAWHAELPSLPTQARPVELPSDLTGFCDAHLWPVPYLGVTFQFCLVRKTGAITPALKKSYRELRLNLLRMHAENIGLNELRRWTRDMPARYRQLEPTSVIRYLESTLVVLRPDRGPKADTPAFRAARAILEEISPGRIGMLLDELQTFVDHPSQKLLGIVQSLHDPTGTQNTKITVNDKGNVSVERTQPVKSPWASGSFYIFCVLAVIFAVRAAFGQLNAIWLPVVLVGGILVSVFVGALQLKQDSRLSERGFLSLIKMAFESLPLIRLLVPKAETKSGSSASSKEL